jgi:hypothetical protein
MSRPPEESLSEKRVERRLAAILAAEGEQSNPRQTVDRCVTVRQYERRPRTGMFRRRHGRGDRHHAIAHPLAFVIARNSSFTLKAERFGIAEQIPGYFCSQGAAKTQRRRELACRVRVSCQTLAAEWLSVCDLYPVGFQYYHPSTCVEPQFALLL